MIYSELAEMTTAEARRALAGLPKCDYDVVVKPLRYRSEPHLAALCDFDSRRIILQVPKPFHSFKERVYHGALRKRGKGMHFSWLSENVFLRSRRDVLRFLSFRDVRDWYLELELLIGDADEAAWRGF